MSPAAARRGTSVSAALVKGSLAQRLASGVRLRREHRCCPGSPRRNRPWSSAMILLTCACVPIGPTAVRSDQVAYADAIGDANKRLALSNIVKIRDGDTPTFLATSQVVAGYQLQAAPPQRRSGQRGQLAVRRAGTLSASPAAFSNNPTITYSPVSGARPDLAGRPVFAAQTCGVSVWRAAGKWPVAGCGAGHAAGRPDNRRHTIFEGTRKPLRTWFLAIWFVTSQKNGMSALGLQRALGLGSYETSCTLAAQAAAGHGAARPRPPCRRVSSANEAYRGRPGRRQAGPCGRE